MMMKLDNDIKYFIKKGNNFPIIKYPISEDFMNYHGINDDMLKNIAVTFSMIDSQTGNYIIANVAGEFIINDINRKLNEEKYYVAYQLSTLDTTQVGNYSGEFVIDFLGEVDQKFAVPVNKYIPIYVVDSITTTTII